MLIHNRGLVLAVLLLVSLASGIPLEALRSLVFFRSTATNDTSCVGVQLQDRRVITSAACDVSALDSVAFVAQSSFMDDGNGRIQLALQPTRAVSIQITPKNEDLPSSRNAQVLSLSGDEASSSLTLLPVDSPYPAVLSEDTTASIIEVDPSTLQVSVVDQVIYVDGQLCSKETVLRSVCVLPLAIESRAESSLSSPWRFLVQHNTTAGAHALLGLGIELDSAQDADGFRLFSWLPPAPSDGARITGPVVEKITRTNEFVAGFRSTRTGFSFCSGSLVASRFVLTATHCTDDGSVGWVTVGAKKTLGKSGEMIQVRRVIRHPSFPMHGAFPRKYDFALLELAQATSRTPIRLGLESSAEILGRQATAFGYGRTGVDGNVSKALRSVGLTFGPVGTECGAMFGMALDESMVCARATPDTGPCSGDSGGPVVLDAETPNQRVVAIHGGGRLNPNGSCSFVLPGWALRVGAAAEFIDSTIDEARTPRPYNPRPGHTQE